MYSIPQTAQANSSVNPSVPTGASSPILSMGMPEQPVQQPTEGNNKAVMLIDKFGQIFQQLNSLATEYPSAQAEFSAVTEALKSWLAKASDSIVSEGGGNSITY